MTRDKAPAFLFYPKDYESDESVKLMSLEQEGAYLRLLSHQWLNGSIPDSVEHLAKICRTDEKAMRRIWSGVSCCFDEVAPGRRLNARLERQRSSQETHAAERSTSGKRGASSRWSKAKPPNDDGSAIEKPMADDSIAVAVAVASPYQQQRANSADASARQRDLQRGGELLREIANLTGDDEREILKRNSMLPARPGRRSGYWLLRLDTGSDEHLARTVEDLNSELHRLRTLRASEPDLDALDAAADLEAEGR
jgi:uncharacterized protein YdaU (DUF1376 family)